MIPWHDISVWLWGVMLVLIGVIWSLVLGRVSKLELEMKSKADLDSMTVLSEAQSKLMDHVISHEKEDRERFETIISRLGELKGKMDALLVIKRKNDG